MGEEPSTEPEDERTRELGQSPSSNMSHDGPKLLPLPFLRSDAFTGEVLTLTCGIQFVWSVPENHDDRKVFVWLWTSEESKGRERTNVSCLVQPSGKELNNRRLQFSFQTRLHTDQSSVFQLNLSKHKLNNHRPTDQWVQCELKDWRILWGWCQNHIHI